eukprot:c17920_g1_i1.p1 GENE.c17920_g1_i1~~c17920_g1_i1.p1  ORF type:complete len:182 (+),score=56.34 c17920_g1_i1:73-618(+)
MVFGFIIHSLDKDGVTNSYPIWFSSFFTPEGNDQLKKKRENFIARRVQEEHDFRVRCRAVYRTGDEQAISTSEDGVLPLKQSDFFQSGKVVVWEQVARVVFVLILERHENRLLAANFLSRFISGLADHFKNPSFPSSPKEILSHSDELHVMLHNMLPCGQLLFGNRSFMKHLRILSQQTPT